MSDSSVVIRSDEVTTGDISRISINNTTPIQRENLDSSATSGEIAGRIIKLVIRSQQDSRNTEESKRIENLKPKTDILQDSVVSNRRVVLKINGIVNRIEKQIESKKVMSPQKQQYYDLLVAVAVERDYQVLGIYVDTHTKIEMQCPDNHRFEITPRSFKSGNGCARCSGKMSNTG